MREKCRKTIFPALLALILVTGCTNSGGEQPDINSVPESSGQAISDNVPGDGTNAESGNTPSGSPDPISLEELTSPLGSSGLRSFDISPDMLYPMSDMADGLILGAVYGDTTMTVQLTDLTTGKTSSADFPIGEEAWTVQYSFFVVNGFPLAVNLSDSTVTIYDRNLQPLRTESLDMNSYFCTLSGNSLAIPDNSVGNGVTFLQIGGDGSVMSRKVNAALPDGTELVDVLGTVSEGEYLISYFDNDDFQSHYGILYEENSEVVPLHISDSKYAVTAGGKLIIADYGSTETEIFDPEFPTVKKVLETPAGASLISPSGDESNLYFYSSAASDETGICELKLYRYDADSGRLTAQFDAELPGEFVYISGAYEFGDSVLLNAFVEDRNRLVLWQPEQSPELRGYDAVSGADFAESNLSLAQRIKDKYSIEVHYGSDGVRHFNDYAVVSEPDEKLINNALTLIDGFLAKFPAGFFDELIGKSSGYEEMCIYLTGQIIPNRNESQSLSDAIAFVTTENDQQIMVLDITQTYGLEKNTAHEFMHIIENAMYGMDYDENGEWLDKENFRRWEMLNPEDFSYYFSYTDEYGNTLGYDAVDYNGSMYYDGSGIDINSIYFVDGYSMTYPNEDRARIFENIATTSADMLPAYFRGGAMQLKAAYLCACIRNSFECITDDTVLFWESGINPAYTLEYFRENYDIDAFFMENAAG